MHFPEEFREEPAGAAEFRARFGARGMSGLSLCRRAEVVSAGLSPAWLRGAQWCAQPRSRAGQQQVLTDFSECASPYAPAQPPACFWKPLAELRALRLGQGDPACSCLRTLFLTPSALPPLQRARVWLWCSAPISPFP